MILSDRSLKDELAAGRLIIEPFDPADLQPASVDVHLGDSFRVFQNSRYPFIDPNVSQPELTELIVASVAEPFVLHPGEFVLGTTLEKMTLPNNILGRLEGKSTLGRIGLLIHSTAGYVDPGWVGHLTLELSNVSNLPILLTPGMRIGQVAFEQLTTPVDRPYGHPDLGSHYQNQEGPTPSSSLA